MNPILVEHFRGNIVESFHRGVICVVDKDNKIVYEKGDISQMCYPRSAMNYFQHIPLLTSGVFEKMGFTEKDLAVMCGSHNGEKIHQDQVSQILEKSGLTTDEFYKKYI
jgi:L-asparaginase II